MVKPARLAERADFAAGPLSVSPARRIVAGPGGEIQLEPITMQVFLLLLDSAGEVVTRDRLFEECWGGNLVGDDSLNRAINRVRRIDSATGPGLIEIETIPRTGYRLTGLVADLGAPPSGPHANGPISRRMALGAAAAATVVGLGGLKVLTLQHEHADERFRELMRRAERDLLFDARADGLRATRAAIAIHPDSASAQGLMAYTQLGDTGGSQSGDAIGAEQRLRIALKLDPQEPYSLLTQTILERSMLDLAATEDRLQLLLGAHPRNISVMRHLWGLKQSVGLSHQASDLIVKAMSIEPLAPATNYPRAQLLWILGQNAEADRIIDRAMTLWPSHRFVRFARFTIYAFTGRPDAALAMLTRAETTPQSFTVESVRLWRVSLNALRQPSPSKVALARSANLDAARQNPALSSQAVLTLSTLGELDAAFEVANALFVFRSAEVSADGRAARPSAVRSTAWRFAPWLFTPPAAALRSDARFKALCDGIGLTDYWSQRRVTPDFRLGLT